MIIRRTIKWLLILLVIAVALVVILFLCKDAILASIIERQIRITTGMDAKIGTFSVGVFAPQVTVRDFKVYNSPAFGGSPLIDIPEFHVEYDTDALAQHKLRIKLLRLNFAELNVVKNELGQTNLVELLKALQAKTSTTLKFDKIEQLAGVKFESVDTLNLTLGKARFTDLKKPGVVQEMNFNIRERVFKNIKSEGDLYAVIALLGLQNSGVNLLKSPAPAPRK